MFRYILHKLKLYNYIGKFKLVKTKSISKTNEEFYLTFNQYYFCIYFEYQFLIYEILHSD